MGEDAIRGLGEAKATLTEGGLASTGQAGWPGAAVGRPPWLTSLASFSYPSISFSFSWFTASTLQILLAAVSACGGEWGAEWLP